MFLKERLYDPLGMHDSLNHESVELGTALQTRGIYTPEELESRSSFSGPRSPVKVKELRVFSYNA